LADCGMHESGRSENMRRIRSKDTKPEMVVRRMLHGLGYRYRLNAKDLPGKPDIVFRLRKRAILVHGCFWHQHDKCREGRLPGSRQEYWLPKLARNIVRDEENLVQLERLGWKTLILWECELDDATLLRRRLTRFLR
jgi:DNA mismatch endonuclease (patch repair protein)